MWLYLIDVCCLFMFVTEVTSPYDWSMFVSVCHLARILLDVARFYEGQSQPGGRERRTACPKNGIGIGIRDCVDTIYADVCSIPTSCRLCLLGTNNALSCCCYRPTPPACSCGGVRQPNFSREALPGVSST